MVMQQRAPASNAPAHSVSPTHSMQRHYAEYS
jgi:hypothetical protein